MTERHRPGSEHSAVSNGEIAGERSPIELSDAGISLRDALLECCDDARVSGARQMGSPMLRLRLTVIPSICLYVRRLSVT